MIFFQPEIFAGRMILDRWRQSIEHATPITVTKAMTLAYVVTVGWLSRSFEQHMNNALLWGRVLSIGVRWQHTTENTECTPRLTDVQCGIRIKAEEGKVVWTAKWSLQVLTHHHSESKYYKQTARLSEIINTMLHTTPRVKKPSSCHNFIKNWLFKILPLLHSPGNSQ